MTTLEDLWRKLFGVEITPLERNTMTGVLDYVGDRSPMLVLAAIQVFFLTKVLLRDPASPFVISSKLGDAMRDLEGALKTHHKDVYVLNCELEVLWERVTLTQSVLSMARKDAREREEFPPRAYRKIPLVSFVGALIAFLTSELIMLVISMF
jgi:hypothetical protein